MSLKCCVPDTMEDRAAHDEDCPCTKRIRELEADLTITKEVSMGIVAERDRANARAEAAEAKLNKAFDEIWRLDGLLSNSEKQLEAAKASGIPLADIDASPERGRENRSAPEARDSGGQGERLDRDGVAPKLPTAAKASGAPHSSGEHYHPHGKKPPAKEGKA